MRRSLLRRAWRPDPGGKPQGAPASWSTRKKLGRRRGCAGLGGPIPAASRRGRGSSKLEHSKTASAGIHTTHLPAGPARHRFQHHRPGTAGFQRVSQKPNRSAPPWWSPHPAQLAAPGLAARSRRQAAGAGAPASRSTPWPPQPASLRHPLPSGRSRRRSRLRPPLDRRLPAGRNRHRPQRPAAQRRHRAQAGSTPRPRRKATRVSKAAARPCWTRCEPGKTARCAPPKWAARRSE